MCTKFCSYRVEKCPVHENMCSLEHHFNVEAVFAIALVLFMQLCSEIIPIVTFLQCFLSNTMDVTELELLHC